MLSNQPYHLGSARHSTRATLPIARLGTLLPVFLVLIAAGPSVAVAADGGHDSRTLFTVAVDTVRESRIDRTIVGTGTVAAWREMPISSEASGLAIVEVLADEGDKVKKGQILARLNQTLLLAQLDQNRAAVDEAEARLSNALSDQKRAHTVSSGVLSQQAIELRETLVKTGAAQLAAARARLEETQARLAQTAITAPADAIVASRSATLGQIVQAGAELFRLIQDERIEVNALVPETDVLRIRPRQFARVIDPTGRATRATVRRVAPLVDERTRLGTVRVALPPDAQLKPGMFVRIEIEADGMAALTVPFKALVWRDGRAAVFTVRDDGTAALKVVTLGHRTSSAVEVAHGLAAGERIVVEGTGLLNDGERVRVDVASAQLPGRTP
ncbi:efflux RND transporter periplasmic adaptor subunit [Xanthobacter autotrophicus]|uniref:efflux RND transporter periplasmic adaptor subunit n=1 Tax=Xanthobacter autotrophicus TaxID=280 RepID=UPI00372C7C15